MADNRRQGFWGKVFEIFQHALSYARNLYDELMRFLFIQRSRFSADDAKSTASSVFSQHQTSEHTPDLKQNACFTSDETQRNFVEIEAPTNLFDVAYSSVDVVLPSMSRYLEQTAALCALVLEAHPTLSLPLLTSYVEKLFIFKVDMTSIAANQAQQASKNRCYAAIEATVAVDAERFIREHIDASVYAYKRACVKTFYAMTEYSVRALNDDELNIAYVQYLKINKQLETVNAHFRYITHEKSKHIDYPDIKVKHRAQLGTQNAKQSSYLIEVPEIGSGYTVHNFLAFVLHRQGQRRVYQGETQFRLTFAEFDKIAQYLVQLLKWFRDFDLIVGPILGDLTGAYTQTGQKPLSEIIRAEKTLHAHDASEVRISRATLAELATHPSNEIVMLIGQLAINLDNHPNKHELKAFIEDMYRRKGLTDNAGRRKLFIQDDPFKFMSLLSIQNIQALLPELMAYAALQDFSSGMGFPSPSDPNFLSILEARTIHDAYRHLLTAQLIELPLRDTNIAARFQNERVNESNLTSMRISFAQSLHTILDNQACSVVRVMFSSSDALQINDQMMLDTLGSDARAQALLQTHAMLERADIDRLFNVLKNSESYASVDVAYDQKRATYGLPPLEQGLTMLKTVFLERVTTRATSFGSMNAYSGLLPLLAAYRHLWVITTKLVHKNTLRILDEGFVQTFVYLFSEEQQADMQSSCEGGLIGKMYTAATIATTSSNNVLEQIITQLKREIVNRSIAQTAEILHRGHEADVYRFQPAIDYRLGLTHSPGNILNEEVERMCLARFTNRYKPSDIYQQCFQTVMTRLRYHVSQREDSDVYQLLNFLINNSQHDCIAEQREQFDRSYRLGMNNSSNWSLAKLERDLPGHLMDRLIDGGYIQVSMQQELVMISNTGRQAIRRTVELMPNVRHERDNFFQPVPTDHVETLSESELVFTPGNTSID